jgi:hypothetical protein
MKFTKWIEFPAQEVEFYTSLDDLKEALNESEQNDFDHLITAALEIIVSVPDDKIMNSKHRGIISGHLSEQAKRWSKT